jgi:DNA-binding PadR family transcriptional regulator
MTNAEFAILSLIAEAPRHGYEIETVIEDRGMREWTEVGFSSIYYLLRKLEEKGLIESARVQSPGRGPDRKVYSVTTRGMEIREQETLRALSEPQRSSRALQLGLANIPALSRQEALQALTQYGQSLRERLNMLEQRWNAQTPLPYFVDGMFSHAVALLNAELEWVTEFRETMENADDED